MKKKNWVIALAMIMLAVLPGSCRQDLFNKDAEPQSYHGDARSKFRVVSLKDIPHVTNFIKKKTGRNDLQRNAKKSDELNFLKFIDEQMYVKGLTLVKVNDDGTFTKKTLNDDKNDVKNTPCS